MALDDQVMTVSDYGRYMKTTKSGKQRFRMIIKSEPIIVATDAKALTRGTAEAVAEHFKQSIGAIGEAVAPNTAKAQKVEAKAYAAGKAWAMRRYSGGRIGATPPLETGRLFNNSGRLLKSIAVAGTTAGWVVNVAANRFNPELASTAGIQRMMERLRALVPGWGDARELVSNVVSVRGALKRAKDSMITKGNDRTRDLEIQKMKAFLGLGRQIFGMLG